MRRAFRLTAVWILIFCGGCAYYQITDPNSGRSYITDNWHMNDTRWAGGAITFTDLHTGDEVTLPASEIRHISNEEAQIMIQGGAPQQTPTDFAPPPAPPQ